MFALCHPHAKVGGGRVFWVMVMTIVCLLSNYTDKLYLYNWLKGNRNVLTLHHLLSDAYFMLIQHVMRITKSV